MISDDMRQADYRLCEKIIEKYSSSFRVAFGQLPKPKRQALFAVYALCRELDDSIDLYQDQARLAQYASWFEQMIAGEEVAQPIFISLAEAYQQYALPVEPVFELIQGIRSDLTFQQPKTEAELETYCYQVAGTVGELILPILATEHHQELQTEAIYLGKAMQLTNILRDIGEDFRAGRIYISQEKLAHYQVDLTSVIEQGVPSTAYQQLWEAYAEQAEDYYQKGLAQLSLFDADSRKMVAAAARIYGAILPEVRRQGYRFDQRAVVPKRVKLSLLAKNT